MARKTFAMAMLAYNLVRSIAHEGANHADVEPYLMSYKELLDWINSSAPNFFHARSYSSKRLRTLRDNFIEVASSKQIVHRPYRWEPRLVKKRPKPFGRMQHSRKDYHAAYLLGDSEVEEYKWETRYGIALN